MRLTLAPETWRRWLWVVLQLVFVSLLFTSAALVMTSMPGDSYIATLQPLSDYELSIRDQLKAHVTVLAGKIGERNFRRYEGLNESADYIRTSFRAHDRGATTLKQTGTTAPA